MKSVSFDLPDYPLEQIKRDYFLYDLCVDGTAQLENIAITIQSLYLYHNILVADNYPRSMESSLCRTMIIMSYSVLEAIVVCVGYKIQNACRNCRHKCACASNSMFENDARKNERYAFYNADEYLREEIKVINLTDRAKKYYDAFRKSRNNVHLASNAFVITEDRNYTREQCKMAIDFLQKIIGHIRDNALEFVKTHNCEGYK